MRSGLPQERCAALVVVATAAVPHSALAQMTAWSSRTLAACERRNPIPAVMYACSFVHRLDKDMREW